MVQTPLRPTPPDAFSATHRGRAVQDVPLPGDGQRKVEDMLVDIMWRQRRFQESLGARFQDMPDEEKIEFIRVQILALTDELHEALAEIGWKPWATSRHINVEEFKGEIIDALHFLINLALVVGMGPHEVWVKYTRKNDRNFARQKEGYDGVSGKCTYCKMALDEPGHEYEPGIVETGYCGSLCAKADQERAKNPIRKMTS